MYDDKKLDQVKSSFKDWEDNKVQKLVATFAEPRQTF